MSEKAFHERRPYLFVIVLEMAVIATAGIVGTITRKLGLPDHALYSGTMLVLGAITSLTLWKMKWWKTIGFRRLDAKDISLLIIPVIPMIGNMIGNYAPMEPGSFIYYLWLTMMVGFVEEGIYRGLMLRALLQKGVLQAVIFTSLLFSLAHTMNALAGWNWQRVLLQLGYSFALGFGWAAFALRTGTIWPLMLVHFLCNFFGFIKAGDLIKQVQSSRPGKGAMIYDIILTVVFIGYGIVVTRAYIKKEKLNHNRA